MFQSRLYRHLISLYPADYRNEFGEEMAWVFEQAYGEVREERVLARAKFYAREIRGLVFGCAQEWSRRLSIPHSHDWKGGSMKSKFRFPHATIIFMLLSLAGVVLSLEQARVVEIHNGGSNSLTPEWPALLWIFARILLIALGTAAVLWGIVFALKRTGVHRLEELKPWREQK